jgi:hypothetical protein
MNTAREFESRPRHHNGSSQITQVAEAAKKLQKLDSVHLGPIPAILGSSVLPMFYRSGGAS